MLMFYKINVVIAKSLNSKFNRGWIMKKLKQDIWQTLSSEYLFRRPWLTVRKDSYKLPDGRIMPEYYMLEYPDWVNTIAITTDKKFVMVSQYRPGLKQNNYELCSGVSEKSDKDMEAAARRELLEETGFGGGCWREYMVISANPSTTNNLVHCFVAEDVKPVCKSHPDDMEDVKVHMLTVDEVRDLLLKNEIKQATHLASLWKFFAENKLL